MGDPFGSVFTLISQDCPFHVYSMESWASRCTIELVLLLPYYKPMDDLLTSTLNRVAYRRSELIYEYTIYISVLYLYTTPLLLTL